MGERLEEFLRSLRSAEEVLHIADTDIQETNAQTQDILHALELEDRGYHDMAKLAAKLKEVRQQRRKSKDLQEILTPVVNWIEDNRAVIKSIERLLGDVRKIEKRSNTRIYTPRTEITEAER